jgi:hypothetical protein
LAASIALVTPAIVFVVSNVLRYELGVPGLHEALEPVIDPTAAWAQGVIDAVVFVGPLVAFALAAFSVLRLRVERRSHAFVGTVEVQWHPALLAVAVVSAVVFGVLGAYVVAENLPCILGHAARC